ncbi:MAG: sigma factor, partial [Solirubrobacteraceae bacterium]
MDEQEWLAERFEEHRTRLRAVAYRMLGSLSEADDAVQDAWLRLSRADTSDVENMGGWLTTVVARVSLNMLRSRPSRREEPIGVRVPEPIVDREDGTDPEHEALLADSVGLALLHSIPLRIRSQAVLQDREVPLAHRVPSAVQQLDIGTLAHEVIVAHLSRKGTECYVRILRRSMNRDRTQGGGHAKNELASPQD